MPTVKERVSEIVQLLQDFPEIGYVYRKEIDGDIRILLYGHYRIAYLIKSLISSPIVFLS
jgi:plasmid stabilization system protein ParE